MYASYEIPQVCKMSSTDKHWLSSNEDNWFCTDRRTFFALVIFSSLSTSEGFLVIIVAGARGLGKPNRHCFPLRQYSE